MGRRSSGSVDERNGRFRARITIKGIAYADAFDTREEAWAWINALREQVDDAPKKAPPTLQSVSRQWFDDRERDGVRHVAKERSVWRTHVEPWSRAYRPIMHLERVHVRDYVRELALGGRLAPATVGKILRLIRGCLAYAHDSGVTESNVAAGLRPPRISHDRDAEWTWLRQPEIDAVLALPLTAEQRALYAVAIYAGLRKSELWHLRWRDVDLGARPSIRVRGPLKSRAALRTVPLHSAAAGALRAWKAAGEAARKPGDVVRLDAYVWPSSSGGRHHPTYTSTWRDKRWTDREGEQRVTPGVKTRAGITRRVRFHDLRHTCASHLVQGTWGERVELYRVAQWMGHSSIAVTQRYSHLDPQGLLQLVATEEQEQDG